MKRMRFVDKRWMLRLKLDRHTKYVVSTWQKILVLAAYMPVKYPDVIPIKDHLLWINTI